MLGCGRLTDPPMQQPTHRRFDLREAPFTPEPDPRYFYMSDSFINILAKAEYAYDHREMGPTVTCGDDGTGKTVLTRILWQRFQDRPTATVVLMDAEVFLSANRFLRHLLLEFRVGKSAKAMEDSYAILLDHLKGIVRSGQKPILVVDHAERLSPDDLDLLARLDAERHEGHKLLRSMLFGGFDLLDHVEASSAFARRVSFFSYQESLAFDEMVDMLDFEWHVAGGEQLPFDNETLHRIYQQSHGNPRGINLQAAAELDRVPNVVQKPKVQGKA